MKEIEKQLKELQSHGVEYVSVNDVLQWINTIRFNQRARRAERIEKSKSS